MSLFDRYDQNGAELFLRDACSTATPQRRFEDLFEQIHQHFQQMQIFSNSDESPRLKGNPMKSIRQMSESVSDRPLSDASALECLQSNGNDEIEESNVDENALTIDYQDDIFLENIAHLLIFHPVRDRSGISSSSQTFCLPTRTRIHPCVEVQSKHWSFEPHRRTRKVRWRSLIRIDEHPRFRFRLPRSVSHDVPHLPHSDRSDR